MSPKPNTAGYTPFGHRLEQLRAQLNIPTQAAFARALGQSPQTFNAWLKGAGSPDLEMLAKIRRETGVDLNFLIAGDLTLKPTIVNSPYKKFKQPA